MPNQPLPPGVKPNASSEGFCLLRFYWIALAPMAAFYCALAVGTAGRRVTLYDFAFVVLVLSILPVRHWDARCTSTERYREFALSYRPLRFAGLIVGLAATIYAVARLLGWLYGAR